MEAILSPILFHDPGGRQHPYEIAPFERQPYHPQAGQPVTLNVIARPAGVIEQVQVEWCYSSEDTYEVIPAELVKNEDEESHWQALLPAYQGDEEIRYRFVGIAPSERIVTPDFSFYVSRWHPVTHVANVRQQDDAVCIDYFVADRVDPVPLCIHLNEDETVQMDWGSQQALPEGSLPVEVVTAPDAVEIRAADFRLRISSSGCISVRRKEKLVLEEVTPPAFLISPAGEILQIRQSFNCPPEEGFYGFGERYNSLDQRGNRLDMRVYEQYKLQGKRTYLPVPFFISSRLYGWFLDSSRYAEFDLAATSPDRWEYLAEMGPGGQLTTVLFAGSEPKAIIKSFSKRTGKPVLPPPWAFGLWVSSNDWDNQAAVLEQLRLSKEHDIPATVLVIEAWSDEINFYIWNDAQYEPTPPDQSLRYADFTFPAEGRWPDPKGMIDTLHESGIRLILWQIPVLKHSQEDIGPQPQHDADEAFMLEKRYCIMNPDGTPYRVRPPWFRGSLLMDFTHPEGSQWWFNKRRYLLEDMGVDGFKTDGGEHLWSREAVFSNDCTGEELWNQYPNLYQEGYTRFIHQYRGNDAVLFSRAGFTGAQKYPTHWTGDENSTWQAYRDALLAMLNAGLSGIPFIGWDLAGFSGELPSAELYLRSAAMAVFCPIMQYHSEYHRKLPGRDRTPWNMQAVTGDEQIIPVFRFFTNLRMNLLPYILYEASESSQSGLPLMRPLFLEFPDDQAARQYPHQYLFGSNIMVAPILQPGVERTQVYLPAGTWYDFWTNRVYEGPGLIDAACPITNIPVFVRSGSVIPLNLNERYELGGSIGNAVDRYNQYCLKVYRGGNAEVEQHGCMLEEMAEGLQITLQPQPHQVTLIVPAARPDDVVLNQDCRWEYAEESAEIRVVIPASTEEQRILMQSS